MLKYKLKVRSDIHRIVLPDGNQYSGDDEPIIRARHYSKIRPELLEGDDPVLTVIEVIGGDDGGSEAAAEAIQAHIEAVDPHGDRNYTDQQIASLPSPSGAAEAAVQAHVGANDPHGDRNYTDQQIANIPVPVTSSADITDATDLGRSLITAANPSAARSAISAIGAGEAVGSGELPSRITGSGIVNITGSGTTASPLVITVDNSTLSALLALTPEQVDALIQLATGEVD